MTLTLSFLNPFAVVIIIRKSHCQLSQRCPLFSPLPPSSSLSNSAAAVGSLPPTLPYSSPLSSVKYAHIVRVSQRVVLVAAASSCWLLFKLGSFSSPPSPTLHSVFLAFSIPVSKIKWKVVASANFRSSSLLCCLPLPPYCWHIFSLKKLYANACLPRPLSILATPQCTWATSSPITFGPSCHFFHLDFSLHRHLSLSLCLPPCLSAAFICFFAGLALKCWALTFDAQFVCQGSHAPSTACSPFI